MLLCRPPVEESSLIGGSEQADSPISSSKIPESSAVLRAFLFLSVLLVLGG